MRTILILLASLLLLAAPAGAQVSSTVHGFSLGLHLQGTNLDPEDDLDDNGGGAGIDFGYGFRNGISLLLSVGVAAMEPSADKQGADYALTQADVGARYSFRGEAARWRPYLEAALATIFATFEDVSFAGDDDVDVEIRGPAFSVGAASSTTSVRAGPWGSASAGAPARWTRCRSRTSRSSSRPRTSSTCGRPASRSGSRTISRAEGGRRYAIAHHFAG